MKTRLSHVIMILFFGVLVISMSLILSNSHAEPNVDCDVSITGYMVYYNMLLNSLVYMIILSSEWSLFSHEDPTSTTSLTMVHLQEIDGEK